MFIKYWRFQAVFLWAVLMASIAWWQFAQPTGWVAPIMYAYFLLMDFTWYRTKNGIYKKRYNKLVEEAKNNVTNGIQPRRNAM